MMEDVKSDKLERIAKSLFAGRTARKCIIIGHNPSLCDVDAGEYVDAYNGDVIRINRLPRPEFARNYGSRTDLLFACKWADDTHEQDFSHKIVIGEDVILDISGDFKGKDRPNLTTGFICILLALHKYDQVELLGFGRPDVEERGHYKSIWEDDSEQNMSDPRFKHDMNFEHRILGRMRSCEFKDSLRILELDGVARRRCAFALYARGDRYLAYQRNVEEGLQACVPDADIVPIDPIKAEACLPDIPERSGKWNWDKSIFMRLAIPLMDDFKDYDRVVWLDVDVDIVSPRFAGILDVETSEDGLAAVRDSGEAGLMREFRKFFPDADVPVYCNSGVLVMDLCKINKAVWREKTWHGIKKHVRESFVFPDQDILNAYFKIKPMDIRYNTFSRDSMMCGSAWLIHYVAGSGKHMLDQIVQSRAKAKEVSARRSTDTVVDAVFVIGKGSRNGNEELRYALRSLDRYCGFVRDVYICGECPSWVDKTKVKHLQWPDRFKHAKDANIIDKIKHACEHSGVAKNILFCSDDQLVTRRCSWCDFTPRYIRKFSSDDNWYAKRKDIWMHRLFRTLAREVDRRLKSGMRPSEVFYYEPHMWMQLDRDKFLAYAKWSKYESRDDTILASGYFNFAETVGTPNFDHVFIGREWKGRSLLNVGHVAYDDGGYRTVMPILRQMFPEPCKYETAYSGPGGVVHKAMAVAKSRKDKMKPSPDEVLRNKVARSIRTDLPMLSGHLSMAEELRLFGVYGWDAVWSDLIERWKSAQGAPGATTDWGEEARAVVDAYMSNPDMMRTVKVNNGPAWLRKAAPRQSATPVTQCMAREKVREVLRIRGK